MSRSLLPIARSCIQFLDHDQASSLKNVRNWICCGKFMNTKPTRPTQAPAEDPNGPDQPAKPSKPAPRRKFILPTFTTSAPTVRNIDYRTFLSDSGVARF